MRMRFWPALAVIAVVLVAASCAPTVDLSKGIEVVDVSTGWRDAGIVGGKNKLVPSVTFRFKNVSEQKLSALQANVVFRHISDDKEWSSFFVKVTGADGLAPGATSDSQRVNGPLGYTGEETRLEMLQNSHFEDAKAQVFAKYGSTQWARVGEYPVDRQLLEK
jgi:hypothetical protein